jgi:hypothetical protein
MFSNVDIFVLSGILRGGRREADEGPAPVAG